MAATTERFTPGENFPLSRSQPHGQIAGPNDQKLNGGLPAIAIEESDSDSSEEFKSSSFTPKSIVQHATNQPYSTT